MSHFTYIKTCFYNLSSLKRSLSKLNIAYTTNNNNDNFNSESTAISLIIPQSNGYNLQFNWNGQEYELVTDLSFWKQAESVDSFINKISKQYSEEMIISTSQKLGFQPINYQQNLDGSSKITLERWNSKK